MSTAVMQSLGVVQALLDTHRDLLRRYLRARADGDESLADVTRGEAERSFSAIWEQLETAANLTHTAGRDASRYDAIKASGAAHGSSIDGTTEQHVGTEVRGNTRIETFLFTLHANDRGLELARAALASLWSAWPELAAQQNAIASQPVADLRPGGLLGFISRFFGS